jgi:hypothetical protein
MHPYLVDVSYVRLVYDSDTVQNILRQRLKTVNLATNVCNSFRKKTYMNIH